MRKSRVYWRTRGGARRAYADFRDYSDVGGRLEALTPKGQKRATSDPDVAQALATARLRELEAKRRGRALHGEVNSTTLAEMVRLHLIAKAESRRFTKPWLATIEVFLKRALDIARLEMPGDDDRSIRATLDNRVQEASLEGRVTT